MALLLLPALHTQLLLLALLPGAALCVVLTLPAPGLDFCGGTRTRSRAEELLPCRVAPDGHVIPVSPAHVALLDVAEIHCVVTYLIIIYVLRHFQVNMSILDE